MTKFPRPVLDYWHARFDTTRTGSPVTISETLDRNRPAMILEQANGSVRAAITPDLATRIGIGDAAGVSVDDLRRGLSGAGVSLHDPDHLFYLPTDVAVESVAEQPASVRRLAAADHAAFAIFQSEAPEQDLDDAYVELDHWAVFGCFEGGRLVSAASIYPWTDSPVADLGVLTLPDVRGRGHARAVVRSIAAFARRQGYEPQYRCQLDNHASVALAKACGFVVFGKWVVAAEVADCTDRA